MMQKLKDLLGRTSVRAGVLAGTVAGGVLAASAAGATGPDYTTTTGEVADFTTYAPIVVGFVAAGILMVIAVTLVNSGGGVLISWIRRVFKSAKPSK